MSENTQLATVETPTIRISVNDESELERLFAENPHQVEGVETLGREDLSIPTLELVQAQSDVPDVNQHLGQYYNTLTGEFRDTVSAVMLSLVKGRAAFDRKFSRDSEPVCRSDDGIQPQERYVGTTVADADLSITAQIPAYCADCPFSRFGDHGEPPLCAKNFNYAMYDIDNDMPVVIRMQRTGTATAKKLNTIAKMRGNRNLVMLTTKNVRSDKGNYYEPVYTVGAATPPDILAICQKLTLDLGNIAKRVQAEIRPNGETGGNGGGNGHANDDIFDNVGDAPLGDDSLPF